MRPIGRLDGNMSGMIQNFFIELKGRISSKFTILIFWEEIIHGNGGGV